MRLAWLRASAADTPGCSSTSAAPQSSSARPKRAARLRVPPRIAARHRPSTFESLRIDRSPVVLLELAPDAPHGAQCGLPQSLRQARNPVLRYASHKPGFCDAPHTTRCGAWSERTPCERKCAVTGSAVRRRVRREPRCEPTSRILGCAESIETFAARNRSLRPARGRRADRCGRWLHEQRRRRQPGAERRPEPRPGRARFPDRLRQAARSSGRSPRRATRASCSTSSRAPTSSFATAHRPRRATATSPPRSRWAKATSATSRRPSTARGWSSRCASR